MNKISIVILNYLNYWDTIECVESICHMQYDIDGIVIVDNHSPNESIRILYHKYKNHGNIILVRTGKNYGYAKGSNIGIKIARERFHSDFVLTINNDTVFCQKEFFIEILSCYRKGVGIIGPQIVLKDGDISPRHSICTQLKDNIHIYLWDFFTYKKKDRWLKALPEFCPVEKVPVLHGCALLFTPDFFKFYQGFYDRTFLYKEEGILYFMCRSHNLKQVYAERAYLYHKEDQSSEESFQNSEDVKRYFYIKSQKYLIGWIVWNKLKKFSVNKEKK